MNEKLQKAINILLISSLLMINIFEIFVNVSKVEANQITVTDDLIIGSLINASQGGNSMGRNVNVERLGGSLIGGQRESGNRLGVTPKRGGGNVSWNPSLVDINQLYDDYINFVININLPQLHYTVPVNRTFNASTNETKNSRYVNGFIAVDPGYSNQIASQYYNGAYMIINLPRSYEYMHVEILAADLSNKIVIRNYARGSGTTADIGAYQNTVLYNNWSVPRLRTVSRYLTNNYGVNRVTFYYDGVGSTSYDDSFTVGNVYFSDHSSINLSNNTIIHNAEEHPTREEFIRNYTSTFRVQYNQNTNQLVENNSSYVYNLEDFSDNSTTINNTYVTYNYIDIIEGTEGGGNGGSEPPPVEEGKGFWASLFDAISSMAGAFGDFITSIPQLILDLLDGLLSLVEKVVELFIPTSEQLQELSDSFSGLTDDVTLKFSPVTESVDSINTVFSTPKSIYDLTYNVQGETINVIPRQLESEINKFKGLLNGVLVLTTFISIYKRFVGREDVIK